MSNKQPSKEEGGWYHYTFVPVEEDFDRMIVNYRGQEFVCLTECGGQIYALFKKEAEIL